MPKPYLLKPLSIYLAIAFFCLGSAVPASARAAINFTEIRELAIYADAAYKAEAVIRALAESNDYSLDLYRTIPGIEVAFLLATNESSKTQLIAIRGTSSVENAMVNISLKLRADPATGVYLHEGFAHSAAQVYAELKPLLKPGYKINLTGHSLGGAVALILAMFIDADQLNVNQVVTFGQPKVTNIPGADKIGHLNVLRIVDPDDLVPLVPLFDPLDLKNVDVYWHVGKEVVLLEDTRYAILEGVSSMLRATKFTQKPLTEGNVRNHQMSAYLILIEARIASSEEVPYKTDMNLFNLFGG